MGSGRRYAVLAVLALAVPAYADPSDLAVVQAGAAKLSLADVQRRLDSIPEFQRRTFGKTDDEVRRHVVDALLVPELLFAEYARERNLAAAPHVRLRLREALERSLADSIVQETTGAGVTDPDLRAYYDAHRDDYVQPERIRIARILVDDEALAKRIATEAAGTAGIERWRNLARENSLDAATKLRGGMVGFVYPDGRTDVPQVAVDPALYAAASKVKDGDLVPGPVKEAGHLAVVWRRGSLPATSRSFETEREAIRTIVVRERAARAFTTLVEGLRQKDVKEENPSLLESLAPEAPPGPSAGPSPSAPAATSADPVPRVTDRGLR